MSKTEYATCSRCHTSRTVNADGRMRKHARGKSICRGSGRPANRLLDDRDARIAELESEISSMVGEHAKLAEQVAVLAEVVDVAELWALAVSLQRC